MMYPVLENKNMSAGCYRLALDISADSRLPLPGQFYNIRCGETKDPLLRRPFSMHRLIKTKGSMRLEILYRVVGKGTEWLSRRKKAQRLDAIGPLGNGFLVPEGVQDVAMVARGIGIAPLYALGEALRTKNLEVNIHVLMGARYADRVFYEEELKKLGEVYLYTDDGSVGYHGRAPQLLLHLLESNRLPRGLDLYACGPIPMLKELAQIAERFTCPGQVALETHMGCGFGACLSCAIPLKAEAIQDREPWQKPALQWSDDGSTVYSLICKDGPVYDILEVDWDEWLA
jgi:dihydroorotate dehydrogenase electron transfer subunit